MSLAKQQLSGDVCAVVREGVSVLKEVVEESVRKVQARDRVSDSSAMSTMREQCGPRTELYDWSRRVSCSFNTVDERGYPGGCSAQLDQDCNERREWRHASCNRDTTLSDGSDGSDDSDGSDGRLGRHTSRRRSERRPTGTPSCGRTGTNSYSKRDSCDCKLAEPRIRQPSQSNFSTQRRQHISRIGGE